jgi:hypothetical protein
MNRLRGACLLALSFLYPCARAQVIEFESNGQKYQTLTRSGVTVMYTHMANHIHEYTILLVAISNGSDTGYIIRPEDFTYERPGIPALIATPARTVIEMLMAKGSSSDVVKLITQYEANVYGNTHFKTTNGYEQRRQAALGVGATKLRAAATASAIALVQTRLKPGDSTDGAVFFANEGKILAGGKLVVRTNSDVFEFKTE